MADMERDTNIIKLLVKPSRFPYVELYKLDDMEVNHMYLDNDEL